MANPLLSRQTAGALGCGAVDLKVANDLEHAEISAPPDLVVADLRELERLGASTALRGSRFLLWTDTGGRRPLEAAQSVPRVVGICGLRYPGAAPRAWELLAVSWRLGHDSPSPAASVLSFGGLWEERLLAPADRDQTVADVERLSGRLVSAQQVQTIAEMTHELVMNAMYDAPVDEAGVPRYAQRRTEPIMLEGGDRPLLGFGSDGARLVVSIRDRFGRLERESVVGGMLRGLASGTMDCSHGGAGLGMLLIHQAAALIFVDVTPGRQTVVTAVVELDVPAREMRTLPRSLHFWTHQTAQAL